MCVLSHKCVARMFKIQKEVSDLSVFHPEQVFFPEFCQQQQHLPESANTISSVLAAAGKVHQHSLELKWSTALLFHDPETPNAAVVRGILKRPFALFPDAPEV